MTVALRARAEVSTQIPMQTIKKVLNSSVVLAVDEHGVERIVLGKGIGYGRKAGEPVPEDEPTQVFVSLPEGDQRHLTEMLGRIPSAYVDLTRSVVALAREEGLELDPHIYLTLTDHLHFAVERHRSGMSVVNRAVWEVRTIYPRHYAVGVRAVELLHERTGEQLPEDEAANVAFHLANAEQGNPGVDSLRIVHLVGQVTAIVTHSTGLHLQRDDLHGARFVTHLRYFAQRLFADRLTKSDDDFLFQTLSVRSPTAVAAAERVRAFVEQEFAVTLPNEEVAFLALHIARAESAHS